MRNLKKLMWIRVLHSNDEFQKKTSHWLQFMNWIQCGAQLVVGERRMCSSAQQKQICLWMPFIYHIEQIHRHAISQQHSIANTIVKRKIRFAHWGFEQPNRPKTTIYSVYIHTTEWTEQTMVADSPNGSLIQICARKKNCWPHAHTPIGPNSRSSTAYLPHGQSEIPHTAPKKRKTLNASTCGTSEDDS